MSDDIPEGWLSKKQAADRLGRSASYVVQMASKGRLHPRAKTIEGVLTNFYDPEEVDALADAPRVVPDKGNDQRTAYEQIALDTVRSVIGLVREPREKVDALLIATIERQERRIIELETKLDAQREATERAKDATAERELTASFAKNEQDIKKLAAGRMIETCGKLVTWWMTSKGNGSGPTFTAEQWEQLLLANNDGESKFLTPEQEEQGKKIIAEHKAKNQGKEVVSSVVETVKKTVETQGVTQ